MIQHTLIFSAPKIEIPSTKIIDFVKDLISANLTNIEYFGTKQINNLDCFNEEMLSKTDTSTFIIFHFDDEEIAYKTHNEGAVLNIIFKKLNFGAIGQVLVSDTTIEIFIH